MKKTALFFAVAVIGLTVSAPGRAAVAVSDDVALYWNQVAAQNVVGSPVTTSRAIAMVGVAVREAVNASLGNPGPSYLGIGAAPTADTRVAASVAARNVLV